MEFRIVVKYLSGLKIKSFCVRNSVLSYNHTERQTSPQASAASEASDLCNGSGTHLERQVKRHHILALVRLQLPLTLMLDVPLDAPLDARCGYTLKVLLKQTPYINCQFS